MFYKPLGPCSKGHDALRYTKTGACAECQRAYRAKFNKSPKAIAYRKKWRSQPHILERDRRASIRYGKLRRYGLKWDEFLALLAKADNKCEVCLKPFAAGNRRQAACVDHDHETGRVRGLLCHSCNRAMGLLGDDVHRIWAMLVYLKKHVAS